MANNYEKSTDEILIKTLEKAYASRSRLFYKEIQSKNIDNLLKQVKAIDSSSLNWDFGELNIAKDALEKIIKLNISVHEIFCHPDILISQPELIDYYRNIAALSQKGLTQILSGRGLTPKEKPLAISKIMNGILSQVITYETSFSKKSANKVLFAELGSEIQGTWVNIIGSGAAKQVERIILEFVKQKRLVKSIE